VILLNLLWWLGWAWFVAWTALPLVLLPELGPLAGGVAWAVLAPWSSLFGMATVHRLLPKGASGRHQMFADPGSVQWALKGWAPGLYLTVFQPVFFLSPAFQRVALGAFQARLGAGATVTSRTVLREPHRVRIGRGSVIGEFAHLVTSYQPRPHVLIVGEIDIGDDVLIAGYCHLAMGVRIGDGSILEHEVRVGPGCVVGNSARVGHGTLLCARSQVGVGAIIGSRCLILADTVIPDGARVPDGATIGNSHPAIRGAA